jgi:histidinol-phosphate aminotransferase
MGGVPEFNPKGVYIDANENPLGPCEAARKAVVDIVPNGGRYAPPLYADLIKLFAHQMDVPTDHVALYDGSSSPLSFTVLAYTSPTRSLVTADPTYEAAGESAKAIGAPIHAVPLAKDYSHDVKAMLAADKNPGVIYICNPNNPTGTITSKAQIDMAVANKPAGTIVLVDEAYIHLSDAESVVDQVALGKDLIVLRTFSKIYGMAGIRCGFAVGRPDLLRKLEAFGGDNPVPVTAMAAANASLLDTELVPARKKLIASTRTETIAWLRANNYKVIGDSQSNCFMIDTARKGKDVMAAMQKQDVIIGRTWPIWPLAVRISVGTPAEMAKFRAAFKSTMDSIPPVA